MKYCFGIDVGGTTVKIGVFQIDGTIVSKWEIKTRVENEGVAILPDIAASLKENLDKLSLDAKDFIGIGIDVPAPVVHGIVQDTANLGWGYKEVKRELEELCGMRVVVGNDADIAALGEMWKGAGKGELNQVMVTLGTGVGGGIITGGRVLEGEHGGGGEIGHICVNQNETDTCGCGKHGCLEQYTSATGITRLAKQHLAKTDRPSLLREGSVNAKTVFDALKLGDTVASEIVEEFASYLGFALANVAVVADPATIVIGGGVSKAGQILLDYIEKYFRKWAFFGNKDTKFRLAALGNDAGMVGAAKLIIDTVTE
jgi:glucokinase